MPGRSPASARLRRGLVPVAVAATAVLGACGPFRRDPAPFPLAKPDSARLIAAGPDSFLVRFVTTKGEFHVKVHRDWAPRGADRIYYLVRARFYDSVAFFRVVNGRNGKPFVAQFGLNGDTAVGRAWRALRLTDDKPMKGNVRGTLSFAAGGANTRTTQIYINYGDNTRLDTLGFAVFGQVVRGMSTVVDSFHFGYGESAAGGPNQQNISREGNAYLRKNFPLLDYVITARVIKEWRR
jgi:peptidyl-prolyl cis-trans isomerase A (cyclophilin A)